MDHLLQPNSYCLDVKMLQCGSPERKQINTFLVVIIYEKVEMFFFSSPFASKVLGDSVDVCVYFLVC